MQLRGIIVDPQNVQPGSKVRATTYLDSNTGFKDVEIDFYVSPDASWKGDRAISVGKSYTDQTGVAAISFTFDPVQLAPAIATANQVQSVIPADLGLNLGMVGSQKVLYLVAYCPQAGDGVAAAMAYDATGTMPAGGVAMGSGSINAQTGQGAQIQVGAGAGQAGQGTSQTAVLPTTAAPTGTSAMSTLSILLVLAVIGAAAIWAARRIW